MPLLSAGLSDIGQKRKTNQDAIYLNPEKNLFIVADGMGGHNGGDIASALAVKTIPEYVLGHSNQGPQQLLSEAISHANQAIKEEGKKNIKLEGMGTTAVSLFFTSNNLVIGNVGDSRAYLISKNKIYQLTRDHSMIQEKVAMGIYTREQGAKDPHKNVLIRTVGFEDRLEVDIFTYKVCKNDLFLLCSDGLHGKVSERDIVHIINTHLSDPAHGQDQDLQQAVKELISQANKNGGQDNISVILILAKA